MRRLVNLLYPPRCIMCGKHLAVSANHETPCTDCLKKLRVTENPMRNIGGLTCLSPLLYSETVRKGVHGLKFYKRLSGVRFCARMMAQCLMRYELSDFDTVTWVPVSRKREIRRGYDQSELLARQVAKIIGVKAKRCLRKTKNTKPNSLFKTQQERAVNVAGAYALSPFVKCGGRILLIDDVLTTGSTSQECASVLLSGGAERVILLTLARSERWRG